MKLEESSLRVAYLMIIIEFESCCMNSMPSFECVLFPAFGCSLCSSFIKKAVQPLYCADGKAYCDETQIYHNVQQWYIVVKRVKLQIFMYRRNVYV
jgi:hypothetical protein